MSDAAQSSQGEIAPAPDQAWRDSDWLGLSASEKACYHWPDDTELHRQCRASYVAGATDYASAAATVTLTDFMNAYIRAGCTGMSVSDMATWVLSNFDVHVKGTCAPAEAVAWQLIETAPKDGTSILVTDATVKDWTHVAYWDLENGREGEFVWAREDTNSRWHRAMFTHWMPLPDGPTAAPSAPAPATRAALANEGGAK